MVVITRCSLRSWVVLIYNCPCFVVVFFFLSSSSAPPDLKEKRKKRNKRKINSLIPTNHEEDSYPSRHCYTPGAPPAPATAPPPLQLSALFLLCVCVSSVRQRETGASSLVKPLKETNGPAACVPGWHAPSNRGWVRGRVYCDTITSNSSVLRLIFAVTLKYCQYWRGGGQTI